MRSGHACHRSTRSFSRATEMKSSSSVLLPVLLRQRLGVALEQHVCRATGTARGRRPPGPRTCCARSRAHRPSPARPAADLVRMSRAVAGSSEAVGSSSSSSVRFVEHGLGQAHARLFAGRENAAPRVPKAREIELLQQRFDPRPRGADAVDHSEDPQVLRDRQVARAAARRPRRSWCAPAPARRSARKVQPLDVNGSGRRLEHAEDHVDGRGLAGAVGAEQAHDLVARDRRRRHRRRRSVRRKFSAGSNDRERLIVRRPGSGGGSRRSNSAIVLTLSTIRSVSSRTRSSAPSQASCVCRSGGSGGGGVPDRRDCARTCRLSFIWPRETLDPGHRRWNFRSSPACSANPARACRRIAATIPTATAGHRPAALRLGQHPLDDRLAVRSRQPSALGFRRAAGGWRAADPDTR